MRRCVCGQRLGFVPYVMPGFGLAKKAIEVFERDKPSDGLILSKHGIVTCGENAREAYERMIEMVTLAEDFIARGRKTVAAAADTAQHRRRSARRAHRARRLQRKGPATSKARGEDLFWIFAATIPCSDLSTARTWRA